MNIAKPAVLAAVAAAVLAVPAPASAEDGAAVSDGEVLCVYYTDPNGNQVGPKVCIPWILPIRP